MSTRSRTNASATPGSATPSIRLPPDILTYCYGSQMVYVTPGEDYDVRSFLPNLPLAAVTDRLIHLASHRYRRRDLPGARRRRSQPDLSGGPRYAWQPARPEDSQDQSQGLVGRRGQARTVRNRGDTCRASAQVYTQVRGDTF
jgi:hypothetical protein